MRHKRDAGSRGAGSGLVFAGSTRRRGADAGHYRRGQVSLRGRGRLRSSDPGRSPQDVQRATHSCSDWAGPRRRQGRATPIRSVSSDRFHAYTRSDLQGAGGVRARSFFFSTAAIETAGRPTTIGCRAPYFSAVSLIGSVASDPKGCQKRISFLPPKSDLIAPCLTWTA
jgi:hypothetical protein